MSRKGILKVKSQEESVLWSYPHRSSNYKNEWTTSNGRRRSSILKIKTQKESRLLTYGESSSSISTNSLTSIETCSTTSPPRVEFGTITIREYARTVGDNPSCRGGAPISIDWDYLPLHTILDIDDYENNRQPRRDKNSMVMRHSARNRLLMEEWDVSIQSVIAATKEAEKTRAQRMKSANESDNKLKAMEMAEKTYRKLKKVTNMERKDVSVSTSATAQVQRSLLDITHSSSGRKVFSEEGFEAGRVVRRVSFNTSTNDGIAEDKLVSLASFVLGAKDHIQEGKRLDASIGLGSRCDEREEASCRTMHPSAA